MACLTPALCSCCAILALRSCSVSAQPSLAFEDAQHHPLPVSLQTPAGMHPGPVILPAVIPVGAEITSEMRWGFRRCLRWSQLCLPRLCDHFSGAGSRLDRSMEHRAGPQVSRPLTQWPLYGPIRCTRLRLRNQPESRSVDQKPNGCAPLASVIPSVLTCRRRIEKK
jgi:hypothetical protein